MYTNVLEFMESSAEKHPEKIAFSDPDSAITYAQLIEYSMSIGTFIASKTQKKSPVVFFTNKTVNCICGFLGTVYAGCFYSVLEKGLPEKRMQSILDILNPSIIITDKDNKEKALSIFASSSVFIVEDLLKTNANITLLNDIRKESTDIDPLYVNFTSGSTGIPKGVVVSHRSVIDFIINFVDIFNIDSNDVLANQAPFDFDVSVKDLYSGLCAGATVALIPRQYFSMPTKLMDYLCEKKVTTLIWAVSALCFVSTMNGLDYKTPDSINKIMFSGEVMPLKHIKIWKRYLPDAMYVNLYGPTEITCNCTYYILPKIIAEDTRIAIGIPFPNENVFLLDDTNQLINSPNVEGEICVSGTALALGYYRDFEKTSKSFVQNPLNSNYMETIYRTGDIAKYDEDSLLHYVSRKDFQIKHMGHRIELGEIETVINSCNKVSRCCCIYYEKKHKILAFYAGEGDKDEIVKTLKTSLPEFMMPNIFIPVVQMPITKNGKVDRTALLDLYLNRKG